MRRRFRSGGLAAWSVRRPIGVSMLALAVVVLGLFALERLGVDLLPQLIYPEVRVRILDPGVPARIMEDRVTRQLEEQLAITEEAIAVQSTTTEGRGSVDLSFPYGADIDLALRDASSRLDRAKRFLPESIEPPVIFKRDPSQIPVMELIVSSDTRDAVALREWVDYEFSKWFLNLPGVAATEVGGAPEREIQILLDQERLAALGLSFKDVADTLVSENREDPGGRLQSGARELSTRSAGRLADVEAIAGLRLSPPGTTRLEGMVRLDEVARIRDTHEDERLRIRLNGVPGVKLSIQKQPQANTVAVAQAVQQQLQWLAGQDLVPPDIRIATVDDQSVYVRHALRNASLAALSGAVLAMGVVWLFLGNLRRTLIIGTAIPLAVLVTFFLMDLSGLTLNIMSLGGLALGIGMLVDNTIVMLENIVRHQREGESDEEAPVNAAVEVTGAVVAATSTNLAAVLPFLFIGGLVGLLFQELIITISAAIAASLLVALTLVPALAARVREHGKRASPGVFTGGFERLRSAYTNLARRLLRRAWLAPLIFLPLLLISLSYFVAGKQVFLPAMDEGRVSVSLIADPGIRLEDMDETVRRLERLVLERAEVASVFTTTGGFVFGRSQFERSNYASFNIQLKPLAERGLSSDQWIRHMQKTLKAEAPVGLRIRMRLRGVRGVRLSRGDDDLSLRIRGEDMQTLSELGEEAVARLRGVPGLRNIKHTYEDTREELYVSIRRERAADLGIKAEDIGRALRVALDGLIVSDLIRGDRQYDIRLRLPRDAVPGPDALGEVLVGLHAGAPVRLRQVADIRLDASPSSIQRDRQRRIVEISGSLSGDAALNRVMHEVRQRLDDMELPPGYTLYDGGASKTLQQGVAMGQRLLALAVFLVLVVMAVQYESLRNPLVILLSVPFSLIGVALVLWLLKLPVSMPVWLGLIMLAGIVVNNAIVLVEQIEIQREQGQDIDDAIVEGARLRLRPILMTMLTTVVGMLPLALGLGEGSEMLQPLAVVIVAGLSFSTLVTLFLVPSAYRLLHARGAPGTE